MKLAFFDEFRLGVVVQNQIFDITEELRDVPSIRPSTLRSVQPRLSSLPVRQEPDDGTSPSS